MTEIAATAMTGAEMRAAREILGLSPKQMASWLGLIERDLERIEKEAHSAQIHDRLVERLAELEDHTDRVIERLMREVSSQSDDQPVLWTFRSDDEQEAWAYNQARAILAEESGQPDTTEIISTIRDKLAQQAGFVHFGQVKWIIRSGSADGVGRVKDARELKSHILDIVREIPGPPPDEIQQDPKLLDLWKQCQVAYAISEDRRPLLDAVKLLLIAGYSKTEVVAKLQSKSVETAIDFLRISNGVMILPSRWHRQLCARVADRCPDVAIAYVE